MGKSRIEMQRLETATARQNTFSKRKFGIVNKAKELSILCDIDILLLMFSPGGKPTIITGEHSNFNSFIEKLSEINYQERTRRMWDTLEVLKKSLKKVGHEIDEKDFSDKSRRTEELKTKLQLLQEAVTNASYRLSCWEAPDNVNDLVQIHEMEESAMKSLDHLRKHKEHLARRGTNIALAAPQEQLFPQIHDHGIMHGCSRNNLIFPMTQRDVGCSTNLNLPNVNVGSGLHYNSSYPCQHSGHNFMGSSNPLGGTDCNVDGSSFCTFPQHELAMPQLRTSPHFFI